MTMKIWFILQAKKKRKIYFSKGQSLKAQYEPSDEKS